MRSGMELRALSCKKDDGGEKGDCRSLPVVTASSVQIPSLFADACGNPVRHLLPAAWDFVLHLAKHHLCAGGGKRRASGGEESAAGGAVRFLFSIHQQRTDSAGKADATAVWAGEAG